MKDILIRSALTMNNLFRPTQKPIYCNKCGTRLKVYYAEEKVCVVKCGYCEYIGIVKADSYEDAALHFGKEKEGGEEDA